MENRDVEQTMKNGTHMPSNVEDKTGFALYQMGAMDGYEQRRDMVWLSLTCSGEK